MDSEFEVRRATCPGTCAQAPWHVFKSTLYQGMQDCAAWKLTAPDVDLLWWQRYRPVLTKKFFDSLRSRGVDVDAVHIEPGAPTWSVEGQLCVAYET